MPKISIQRSDDEAGIAKVRELMREYGEYLAKHLADRTNCHIAEHSTELSALPGPYSALLLAQVDGEPAGCVAVKPMRFAEAAVEMKRLWVRPRFRGLGLGRRLIEAVIEHAKETGARSVYLDTVPQAMPAANRLYDAMGFERVERYNDNSVAGAAFFRLKLPDGVR